jgi:hypothetical protein
MSASPTWSPTLDHDDTVVFAGRHDIASTADVVTEALPRAVAMVRPDHWVIADALTFPWEHLTPRQWDAPMDVILPDDWTPADLSAVLRRALFQHLGPFDTVVARPWVWRELRNRHGWAETQFRRPTGALENTVRQLVTGARIGKLVAEQLSAEAELARRWQVRTLSNKARDRAERAVIEPALRRALGRRPRGGVATALDYTESTGRHMATLTDTAGDVTVLRERAAEADQAGYAYPAATVVACDDPDRAPLALESIDVALVERAGLAHGDAGDVDVAREVWAALRVGGTMVVLCRTEWGGPDGIDGFHDVLLDAVDGAAVLESTATVRDPTTGRASLAVMSFLKIGVPYRW